MAFRKILIAVDNSAYSFKAAKIGIALSRSLGAQAAFLYVINDAMAMRDPEGGISPAEITILLKKEAAETVDQLIKMYGGEHDIVHFTPTGIPHEEIIMTAKEWEADVIIMGSHGRSGLSHLLMGSVSEQVLKRSPVPVLIIPSKER
jgi:nucleotide-binding universal stress UspA family protein